MRVCVHFLQQRNNPNFLFSKHLYAPVKFIGISLVTVTHKNRFVVSRWKAEKTKNELKKKKDETKRRKRTRKQFHSESLSLLFKQALFPFLSFLSFFFLAAVTRNKKVCSLEVDYTKKQKKQKTREKRERKTEMEELRNEMEQGRGKKGDGRGGGRGERERDAGRDRNRLGEKDRQGKKGKKGERGEKNEKKNCLR